MKQFVIILLAVIIGSTFNFPVDKEEAIASGHTILNNEAINTVELKQMQWVYGGYRFTTQLQLDYNTYKYYARQTKRQSYQDFAREHATYPYLNELALTLKKDADQLGYKGEQLVAYLTAFVQQNITYTNDPYNNGYDYPKYPIETLYEKKGDCEDSAILLVSLLKKFGFDAVLLQLPKHMAVGAAVPNWKGTHYNFEGKKYAYIETTNPKWKIGQMPTEYKKQGAEIIKTPHLKKVSSSNPIDTPLVERIDNTNPSNVKTVTINGEVYTVRPNETYIIKQNGLVINISNQ